jgi:hypothetical protein
MLSEFDNIEAGRALTHPNQFRPAPGEFVFMKMMGIYKLLF